MLVPLADNLWIFSPAQSLPGGLQLGARMTVVRLPGGELWLHSVVPIDDAMAAAIDALGPVRHLVAPNCLHHLTLGEAIRRWPTATTWGAPGLAEKRPDLRLDRVLEESAAAAWGGVIEAVTIDGAPTMGETVFIHRPSGSLLVGDLVFAFRRAPNLRTGLVLWLMGALGGLRQSRAWRFFTRDRRAAAASAARVLALPFDRVIPCHGAVIETGGHEAVASALRWMLGGRAPPALAAGSNLS